MAATPKRPSIVANRAPHDRRKAAVIVEAAVVMPIMIVLTFLMIQYGLLLNFHVSLTSLAREAARYAAVHPETDAAIETYIQDNLPPQIAWEDLTVSIKPVEGSSNRDTKKPITVTLTYDASSQMFLGTEFFGIQMPGSQITAQAVMMIE